MSNIVKLQVPMDKDVRDALSKKAAGYGFDSVQAYIRFLAKAEVDGRKVDLAVDDWGEPSPEAIARWSQQIKEIEADKKTGNLEAFNSVDELMRDLRS